MIIGSNYFFSSFPDYQPNDKDILIILENELPAPCLHFRQDNEDIFLYSNMSKEEWIQNTFEDPIKVGKWLIPEFCKIVGLEVNELSMFDDLFNKLDDKHRYEKIIYNAYLENGSFTLNEEQLNNAYNEYKLNREEYA